MADSGERGSVGRVNVDGYDTVEAASRRDVSAPAEGILIACSYDPSGRNRMGTVFRTLALIAQRPREHPRPRVRPGLDG